MMVIKGGMIKMNIDGIVLAAGLSSRMGKYKMSLKLGSKTVIESCIEPMYDLCSNIIVVVGYNYNTIVQILKPYKKVKIVLNSCYMEGMFSSVKLALNEVTAERFFLIPGDYPVIKRETYERMIESKENIVIPVYQGQTGHPILVNSNLIYKILDDPNYSSLRDFIKYCGFITVEVQDEGILMDIDTIEDYKKVLSYYKAIR
jgi:molybdenum cofactor cytidylyltransferase